MDDDYSIVEIFDSDNEGRRCGYCKSTDGSLSYGMWGHSLTVRNYQDLIDRGWRRSGKYCYKPLMQQTCCPQYTIRCSVADFKLTKSQKKVLRRMHRFLSMGKDHDAKQTSSETGDCEVPQEKVDDEHLQLKATVAKRNMDDKVLERTRISPVTTNPDVLQSMLGSVATQSTDEVTLNNISCKPPVKSGSGACPDKPLRKKAKLLRLERKLAKQRQSNNDLVNQTDVKVKKEPGVKTLNDYLTEPLPENPAHRLELKLVRSQDLEKVESKYNQIYKLYQNYQITIHEDSAERCSRAQFERFLVDSPLEVTTVRCWPQTNDFRRCFPASYDVYCRYQSTVHLETESDYNEEAFTEFLIESPLKPIDSPVAHHPGYGSFHQQYWLDDTLIAVGVIDILPCCISSVYFFYDPKYGFLSLGSYGALREIAFTQELFRMTPELRHYYMGYYIHNCVKMRYKGHFQPSFLLCPEVYTWHSIEKVRSKLEARSYSRLDDRSNVEDEDGKVILEEVMVLHRRTAMVYTTYDSFKLFRNPNEAGEVLTYAKYVGKKCSRRTLLYRS